jgi:hypothetical protein
MKVTIKSCGGCVLFFKNYAVALQWLKKVVQQFFLLPLFSARHDEKILPKKTYCLPIYVHYSPKARKQMKRKSFFEYAVFFFFINRVNFENYIISLFINELCRYTYCLHVMWNHEHLNKDDIYLLLGITFGYSQLI